MLGRELGSQTCSARMCLYHLDRVRLFLSARIEAITIGDNEAITNAPNSILPADTSLGVAAIVGADVGSVSFGGGVGDTVGLIGVGVRLGSGDGFGGVRVCTTKRISSRIVRHS